jgi:hypothetical protein
MAGGIGMSSSKPGGRGEESSGTRAMRGAGAARGTMPVTRARPVARAAAAFLAPAACAALAGIAAPPLADAGVPSARAARTLTVKDEGHLHLVRESGSLLVEEGTATGTLPGTVKVRFDVGPTISAQFTIYARGGGSIAGHGSGKLHSTSAYSTFGGALSVTSGTGRFAHARGSGGLYGAINRRTYALTVQTIGKLSY